MKTISVKKIYSEGKILENKELSLKNGKIISISEIDPKSTFDYENLAPALIDLHINGGEEYHFTASPTPETLADIENSAAKNGVGYTLPTLITSSFENIENGLQSIDKYLKQNPDSGILGMHLEGPFLSVKKRGAHLVKYIQKPDIESIKKISDISKGLIKMLTIAPEEFDEEVLDFLISQKIKLSVGHSNASFEQAQAAFGKGISLVTHLFNAMSPFGHREPGLIGASLYNQNVYSPIILDDVHISKKTAEIAYRLKKEKLFLISDALFQNHKKQSFTWEEFDAKLLDGNYVNSDGNLAGATISLADAVKNAVDWLKIPIETALNMATGIPSQVIDSDRKIGKIAIDYEAKFCSFNNQLTDFKVIN